MKYIMVFLISNMMIFSAQAHFFVDYQGLDPNEAKTTKNQDKLRSESQAANDIEGKRDPNLGIVTELGEGQAKKIQSFGKDIPLADALNMILPTDWFVYLDHKEMPKNLLSWGVNNKPWTDALESIGQRYKYQVIIDWDQKLVQLSKKIDFKSVNFDQPLTVVDNDKEKYLIIFGETEGNFGFLINAGETRRVKVGK